MNEQKTALYLSDLKRISYCTRLGYPLRAISVMHNFVLIDMYKGANPNYIEAQKIALEVNPIVVHLSVRIWKETTKSFVLVAEEWHDLS